MADIPQIGIYEWQSFPADGFLYYEGYTKLVTQQTIAWIARHNTVSQYAATYSDGIRPAITATFGSAHDARDWVREQVNLFHP